MGVKCPVDVRSIHKNGILVMTKYYNIYGNEIRCEQYDKSREIIHWYEREYDINQFEIHYIDKNGFECWTEYDESGLIIYQKHKSTIHNTENEFWKRYDSNNHLTKLITISRTGDIISNSVSDYFYDNNGSILDSSHSEGRGTIDNGFGLHTEVE